MSKYQSLNPYINEVIKTYPEATDQEIEDALTRTHALYKKWRSVTPAQRASQLEKITECFIANREKMAKMMTQEMGKLLDESYGEVDICINILKWYVKNGAELLKPTPLQTDLGKAYTLKQATGVIMACEPWNFPLYQIIRVFAPNFIVGNPMILKHAHNVPGSAALAQQLVEEGGGKDSLINLYLSYDQIGKVIADERIQGVALTGSERGGAAVAMEAGKNLKKSTMELGGNDPFIVLADADPKVLADVLKNARTYNSGQVCTSSKRIIVVKERLQEVLTDLKQAFSACKPGDPMKKSTTLAPLNSQKAVDKLQKQVDAAIAGGAKIYWQFPEINEKGAFFRPLILTDIKKDNPIYNAELFGPVAEVYEVPDEATAINLANDSSYGLGSSVISSSYEHATKVAAQIETGMTVINGPWITAPELPFGGVKKSGYGRELSESGILAFVNEHLVIDVTQK